MNVVCVHVIPDMWNSKLLKEFAQYDTPGAVWLKCFQKQKKTKYQKVEVSAVEKYFEFWVFIH